MRVSLARASGSKKWGLVAGEHFGYELSTADPECTLVAEYRFVHGSDQHFHVLVYNKSGPPIPEQIQRQAVLQCFKRTSAGSAFLKAMSFFVLILLLLGMNSTCQRFWRQSVEERANMGWISVRPVCENRIAFLGLATLGVIAAYSAVIVHFRVRGVKQFLSDHQHPKSH